ncbi:MAG: glycosyltransferase family 4 protein [Flavisolibacter sp.]
MSKVVIIGSAHPLRGGGISTFNERLAEEFKSQGHQCTIVSFSLQYPSIFFPGKSQYSLGPPPKDLVIYSLINSINPINWLQVGNQIRKWKPDVVVVRFWIPFLGAALGTIVRQIKKNGHSRIICIADNIIPHERRPGDSTLTQYFLKACDAFIVMSENVMNDLRSLLPKKPVQLVEHPLYDNFGPIITKEEARKTLGWDQREKIILFFGFIRKYKGLDLLIKAMADPHVRLQKITLVIAGEFYDDEKYYRQLIDRCQLGDHIIIKSNFIADHEVKNYLCACDCIVQPYKNATQSGVTPLAYFFEKPMIVTNVGGLPSMVKDQKVGLVCFPDPSSIAEAIIKFYAIGEDHFIAALRREKLKYKWSNLTQGIFELAGRLKN